MICCSGAHASAAPLERNCRATVVADRRGAHRLEEAGDDLLGRLPRLRRARVEGEAGQLVDLGGRLGLHDRALAGHLHAAREQGAGGRRDAGPRRRTGRSHAVSRASSGTSGSGECRSWVPRWRGQGEPELGALAGPPPGLQPAAVQVGVLERDRQPEAGAAARAGARRVGPPEPVEHHRRLPRAEPDAVVAHRDGGGLAVGVDEDLDVARLGVVDGVGDQVAHDALHAAYVGLGDAGHAGVVHDDARVPLGSEGRGHVGHAVGDVDQVDVVGLEDRGAGVEAADLEQVGEQGLEAVELLLQQLGGAAGDGVEEGLGRRG